MLPATLVVFLAVLTSRVALGAPGSLTKAFNYQGSMPIKDDRTGEIIKMDSNETSPLVEPTNEGIDSAEAEAACWKLINEQSLVTFALQNKVLDELVLDLKKLNNTQVMQPAIEQISQKMRANMKAALDALSRDSADEFFDSLFEASEDIIQLSALLREPKLDDTLFLALIKAVSRLGRNNSMLIQDFMVMCSFARRSPPRPRSLSLS